MARKALEPNLWTIGDTFKHMIICTTISKHAECSQKKAVKSSVVDEIFS